MMLAPSFAVRFRADADDARPVLRRSMNGLNRNLAERSKDRRWESESQRFSS